MGNIVSQIQGTYSNLVLTEVEIDRKDLKGYFDAFICSLRVFSLVNPLKWCI